jgi:hypothetical protein
MAAAAFDGRYGRRTQKADFGAMDAMCFFGEFSVKNKTVMKTDG